MYRLIMIFMTHILFIQPYAQAQDVNLPPVSTGTIILYSSVLVPLFAVFVSRSIFQLSEAALGGLL